MSFTTELSKGATDGDSAVARVLFTTGMGEAVWSAAAGLAGTTGIGMTVMGMGGGKGGAGARAGDGAGTGTGEGAGARAGAGAGAGARTGGRCWWL